jgi:hypothetical protein
MPNKRTLETAHELLRLCRQSRRERALRQRVALMLRDSYFHRVRASRRGCDCERTAIHFPKHSAAEIERLKLFRTSRNCVEALQGDAGPAESAVKGGSPQFNYR